MLDEEKNGYVARDQLLIVKSWTHTRSHRYGSSVRSRGNKDQSGLSYRLHYRDTLSPPSAGHAQNPKFGLLVDTGGGQLVQVDWLVSNPLVFGHLS